MRPFLFAPNSAQYYSLRQCTTPFYKVLLRSTKYYSGTIPYYKVLLCTTPLLQNPPVLQSIKVRVQYYYYPLLHSTTPVYYSVLKVLLRTTKYYSGILRTTKHYSSILLRTTRYYSSTIPYYKVLLQYYSAIQSATPVLLRTTKY